MANQEYKEISPELLQQIDKSNTWSIESMAGHKATNRSVAYVGSTRQGDRIRDYYKDNSGGWWYRNRAVVNGCIVSMEVYIFGKEPSNRGRGTKY